MLDGYATFATLVVSSNALVLAGVILNNYRIGKIEGRLKNGGYITCPFYKGHVNNEVKKGAGGKKH